MPKQLAIASLAFALGAGAGYVVKGTGDHNQPLPAMGRVELTGIDARAVLFDDAGEPRALDGATVACAPGGYLDGVRRDDKEWCSDGRGVTWVRDAKGAETIEVISGKAYATRRPD